MPSETLQLAYQELEHYHIQAELLLDTTLPSFEIRVERGRFTISAPTELELLYGVYDTAERFGGWCFFEPGRERYEPGHAQLPQDGVVVPARKPLLKRRGFIQEFPFNEETPMLFDWMVKNKLNYVLAWMSYYDDLPPEWKHLARVRGIEIEAGHHNFNYLIPGRLYSQSHPDFFAEIGGKRIQSSDGKSNLLLSEQLCTTNPELRAEFVKKILEYCEKNPEIRTVSLVPNDGFGWCECAECSKFYDKNNKGDFYNLSQHVYRAGRIYHDLLRDVSARLQAARPDLHLSFFAYVNYCSPSEGFRLTPGLSVHFAPYWRCINHSIDDEACPINSHYAQDILNWEQAKAGGELNIYEYYMGVNFYLSLPMIHFHEMFHEMAWYARHHVDGILTQYHLAHWTAYGLNYVMMARAARGEEEASAIRNTFHAIFGKDAAEAWAFFAKVKSILTGLPHCHIPYPYALLSRTRAAQYEELAALAKSLLEKAPGEQFRQELVIWCEYMLRFQRLFDAYHEGKLALSDVDAFLAWIASHKNTRVFVQAKFPQYFQALKDDLACGRPWLHFNIDWEDEYIRKHSETIFA